MQKLSLFTCVLLLFIFLYSCENKDPYDDPSTLVLPPITMEGKGTFGCKVNGEIWVPYVENVGLFNRPLEISNDVGTIRISARLQRDKKKRDESIGFQFKGDTIGVYQEKNGGIFSNLNLISTCSGFNINSEYGKINILFFDTNRRILSGTFEFLNLLNDCSENVNITEGRFDLKY